MNKKNARFLQHEMKEINGTPATAPAYVFGMHKGGSTMLHDFFEIITLGSKIKSISISNILFRKGISDDSYTLDRNLLSVLEEKFIYYGFRYIPAFMLAKKSHFINKKAIVLIRDPRDCIVSAYYSFLKSHVISSNVSSDSASVMLKEREKFSHASIDEYCLSEYYRFVEELNAYAYFAHENMRIYRYEDIIFNKRVFFQDALDFLGVQPIEHVFERALSHVDILPDKEDQNAHIRSVSPGNHKIKLKPETIDILTEQSKDTLQLFGYV